MGTMILGFLLLFAAFFVRLGASLVKSDSGAGRPVGGILKLTALGLAIVGVLVVVGAANVVINPGQVGVQHAFGTVSMNPLLPGIRIVPPWASVERFSSREEQWPPAGQQVEEIEALSSEQMGMHVEVSIRWQIDPMQAPRIYTEIGDELQIQGAVLNAIRKGVRDGMVQYSINDISKRTQIAQTMEALVDSALITQPRSGTGPLPNRHRHRVFPPRSSASCRGGPGHQRQDCAGAAGGNRAASRVEVARLQAEQVRLLNQTLTPEALTKQYLEVLRDMKGTDNLVIIVPTEGGPPDPQPR